MQDNQASPNDDQNHQEPNQDRAGRSLSYADVNELLPIFVLGALERDEMLAMERYVNQHQVLLERLVDLEAATAQLAYTAPYAPLPLHAKTQLLQRVQVDVADHSSQASVSSTLFPPRARLAPKLSAQTPLPVAPHPQSRNWFGAAARTLVLASVAAAFFLVVISALQLRNTAGRLATQLATTQTQLAQIRQQNTQLQATIQTLQQQATQLAAAQAQVAQLKTQNTRLQAVNQALQEQLQNRYTQIAVLTNVQRQVTLAGTKDAPSATGAFYIHDNTGVLVLRGLQPLADTQAYQLWFIPAQGKPRPSGLIQLSKDAPDTLLVTIPTQDQNFAVLGVTVEPATGSPTPTGALVLSS